VSATAPPALGNDNVFDQNSDTRIIYVPASTGQAVLNAYKEAEYWEEYEEHIQEHPE
jgi:hypothetical protein